MNKADLKENYKNKLIEFEKIYEKLLELIKESIDIIDRSDPESIYDNLALITNNFSNHFSEEEKFLKRYNYPEFIPHRQAHRAFIKRVLFFRRGSEENHQNITKEVVKFLNTWRSIHALENDREYFPFIRVQLFLEAHHK